MEKLDYKQLKEIKRKFDNIDKEVLNEFNLYRNISLNTNELEEKLNGTTVLVTGGAGSIGSELCKQLINLKVKKIIILDIYENATYMLYQDLKIINNNQCDIKLIIGSICDNEVLDNVFKNNNINYIFHAAAYKHVPLMEENPKQAISTNCIGTKKVYEYAKKYNVNEMILISTDKAINPTSIMGASKKLAEMIITSDKKQEKTKVKVVRFGNVFNSNGSLVPILIKQILSSNKITITHKDATRYFMSIKNAVSLILNVLLFDSNQKTYVLDMQNQISIVSLAEIIIRFFGLIPYKDINIEYIGLRESEKIAEETIDYNIMEKTSNSNIYIYEEKTNKTYQEIEQFLNDIIKDFEKDKLIKFIK